MAYKLGVVLLVVLLSGCASRWYSWAYKRTRMSIEQAMNAERGD